MTYRSEPQLMSQLRRRSFVVSGFVALCLIAQAIVPGVTQSPLMTTDSATAESVGGCCVVNLSAMSACCCGTLAGEGCGCACGKTTASKGRSGFNSKRPADSVRTFQSEICGCGGKHRPGMITTAEPAVLIPLTEVSVQADEPSLPESQLICCAVRLAPPTPPPELMS